MLTAKDIKNITMIIDSMYNNIKILSHEECSDLLEKLDEEAHVRQVHDFIKILDCVGTKEPTSLNATFCITYGTHDVQLYWNAMTYNAIRALLKDYEEELK